jgi:hypothetical protein
VRDILDPQGGWSVEYWLTVLYNNGTLYWVIGGVVAAFLLIYVLFRTPRS